MKITTDSQLAEQAFRDYQKTVEPTDERTYLAWLANIYASHFGVPLHLEATSPAKLVGVARYVLRNLNGVKIPAARNKQGVVYTQCDTRWVCKKIADAWGLKDR